MWASSAKSGSCFTWRAEAQTQFGSSKSESVEVKAPGLLVDGVWMTSGGRQRGCLLRLPLYLYFFFTFPLTCEASLGASCHTDSTQRERGGAGQVRRHWVWFWLRTATRVQMQMEREMAPFDLLLTNRRLRHKTDRKVRQEEETDEFKRKEVWSEKRWESWKIHDPMKIEGQREEMQ